MDITRHEDLELAKRIAGVVLRLDHANRLRLLGYAKGIALQLQAGPDGHEAITVTTFDEAAGLADAYMIPGYPAAAGLLDLFVDGHSANFANHGIVNAYAKSRSWEEVEGGESPVGPGAGA